MSITRSLILESFKTVRDNTIEVARDIPEDKYTFRATDQTNTVFDQLLQVIRTTEFMTALALRKEPVNMETKSRDEWLKELLTTDLASIKTKDQIVAVLKSSFDGIVARVSAANEAYLNETFLAPDGKTKVRLWVIQCAKEQEMVLRGQLFLMERMLGIVPHLTRRQMEVEAERARKLVAAKN